MGLSAIQIARETVKTPGGEFAVRGLSTSDIIVLVREHKDFLTEVFAKVSPGAKDQIVEFSEIAAYAIANGPMTVARVIALAADSPDEVEVAAALPFPVQLEALETIGKLTFEVSGGVKNVLETVIRLSQGMTGLANTLRA